jgi:hypothetical protein
LPFLRADLLADGFDDLDRGRTDGRIHGISPKANFGAVEPLAAGYLQGLLRRKAAGAAKPAIQPSQMRCGVLRYPRLCSRKRQAAGPDGLRLCADFLLLPGFRAIH